MGIKSTGRVDTCGCLLVVPTKEDGSWLQWVRMLPQTLGVERTYHVKIAKVVQ